MLHTTPTVTDDAAGRFEPCAGHRGADTDAPCADCGWLAADHAAQAPTPLALVIEVSRPPARPLRRAS